MKKKKRKKKEEKGGPVSVHPVWRQSLFDVQQN